MENNYATQEASKRLVDAGILERCVQVGDRVQHITGDAGFVIYSESAVTVIMDNGKSFRCDPRTLTILYSMAEVWRELPFQSYTKMMDDGSTLVWVCDDDEAGKYIKSGMILNPNPTDALIDLLIWVKKT